MKAFDSVSSRGEKLAHVLGVGRDRLHVVEHGPRLGSRLLKPLAPLAPLAPLLVLAHARQHVADVQIGRLHEAVEAVQAAGPLCLSLGRELANLARVGGRYWIRTSDLCDVNAAL